MGINRVRPLLAVILLFVVFGVNTNCRGGGSGPLYERMDPGPGAGVIYVYRTPSMVGGNDVFYIRANGELVTQIGNGGFFPISAQQGDVTVSIKPQPSALQGGCAIFIASMDFTDVITIPVEAGEVYYLKYNYATLELVSDEVGENEIQGLRQFNPVYE